MNRTVRSVLGKNRNQVSVMAGADGKSVTMLAKFFKGSRALHRFSPAQAWRLSLILQDTAAAIDLEAKKKKKKKTACANCHQGQHAHLGKPNCQESRCGCPCRKKS